MKKKSLEPNPQLISMFSEEDLKLVPKHMRKKVSYRKNLDVDLERSLGDLKELINEWISECGEDAVIEIYTDYGDSYTETGIHYDWTESDDEWTIRIEAYITSIKESKKRAEDLKTAEKKRTEQDKTNRERNEKTEMRRLMKKYGVENK